MSKVVIVDSSVLLHQSIFVWRVQKTIPATWYYTSMLISNLKRVNVEPDDIVIIACDSPLGSWRRDVDKNYKANRKEGREKYEDIDWKQQFADYDRLINNIDISTPFHIIKIDRLEADDIIAVSCRYYKDKEVIIISIDTDFEQLVAYKNVKLFSPRSKQFKNVTVDPYKLIAKKIRKETTDNLTTEIVNEQQYMDRYTIINLLSLPKSIEEQVEKELNNLQEKDFDISKLQFKGLIDKFINMYNVEKKEIKVKGRKKQEVDTNQEVLL